MNRRRTLPSLLVATVLFAGPLSSNVVAKQPPHMDGFVPVDAYVEMSILSFNDDLCVDDVMPIVVSFRGVVVYSDGMETKEVSRDTGRHETVQATIADPSVASVSPDVESAVTGSPATFSIVAHAVGTTTITYHDGSWEQAADVTETVVVKDCHWELSMISVWKPTNLGFRPTLLAALINVRLQSGPPGQDVTTPAKLSSSATAPRYGDCVPKYSIERTDTTIRSRVLGAPASSMFVGLTFTASSPQTRVCHVPYVGGGRGNTATPEPLNFTVDTRKKRQVFNLPHVVRGEAGSWKGTTTIIMRKVES